MVGPVALQRWETKSVLLSHLDSCGARTLVVGSEADGPRAFYSFSIGSAVGQLDVGVISSGLGTTPAAILLESGRRVLVGYDTWVAWIDAAACRLEKATRLGGTFFEFLRLKGDHEVVALHELGDVRVDAGGAVKWSVDTDVVQDSAIDTSGNLHLKVMDGPTLVVSLASGAVAR